MSKEERWREPCEHADQRVIHADHGNGNVENLVTHLGEHPVVEKSSDGLSALGDLVIDKCCIGERFFSESAHEWEETQRYDRGKNVARFLRGMARFQESRYENGDHFGEEFG